MRFDLDVGRSGEPSRLPTISADDPEITAVFEGDCVAAHCGMAEQTRPLGIGAGGAQESKSEGDGSTGHRWNSEEGREAPVYYGGIPLSGSASGRTCSVHRVPRLPAYRA